MVGCRNSHHQPPSHHPAHKLICCYIIIAANVLLLLIILLIIIVVILILIAVMIIAIVIIIIIIIIIIVVVVVVIIIIVKNFPPILPFIMIIMRRTASYHLRIGIRSYHPHHAPAPLLTWHRMLPTVITWSFAVPALKGSSNCAAMLMIHPSACANRTAMKTPKAMEPVACPTQAK